MVDIVNDKQISKKTAIYGKLLRKTMHEHYTEGKYGLNKLNDLEALKSDWETVGDDIKKAIGLKKSK